MVGGHNFADEVGDVGNDSKAAKIKSKRLDNIKAVQ